MRFTFHPDSETGCRCTGGDAGIRFSISRDPAFQNRDYRFWEDSFLFDGYSHWFRGNPKSLPDGECFTISLSFLPVTYSAYPDGLFTDYSAREHKGMEILLKKGGIVTVNLGIDGASVSFSSIRAHARAGMRNVVTVVYRGDAGWCDLYVNGVFSNRKQFRRHTKLTFPEGCPYIGRRMDGDFFTENVPFGCFYGFLQWAELDSFAKSEAEILSLHHSVFTGVREETAFLLAMPRRSAYTNDRQRPAYHLSPSGKWMNEPHGPMYHDGWYHIFYQANPHAPIWDHLCWGHLKSRDMVHWQDCPLALIPEKEPVAPDGCWSGSSVIGKDGRPRIYFTAGDNRQFPNQAVALATPDDSLDQWYTRPELIQTQDMGWMGEFRDPFVWLENGTYFMLVGTGDADNGGGNAVLYSSDDGIHWESHGFLVQYDFEKNKEGGHVWELPVLLPLRDESGAVVCHILLLCACQIEGDVVETYYFLGHWDPEKRTFAKFHDRLRLLDLGRGVFTGPSGFVTTDGRTVIFTIAQGKRSFMDEVHAGWAHNGGLPVELSIRKGQLHIQPIREITALRGKKLLTLSSGDEAEANGQLAQCRGDQLCLEYTSEQDRASVTLCFGNHIREIFYDRTARRLGVRDENGEEIGRWRGQIDNVDIGEKPISFTCYLDHSMLEIYLNGRKSVTLRNYTEGSRHFQIAGEPKSLTLWKMGSAYQEDDVE